MPIEIRNAIDLRNIENDMSADYMLMNDIDLGGANFDAIESAVSYFTGTLDGQNYKIYNGTISWGLFLEFGDQTGTINTGTIKNLTLEVNCTHDVLVTFAYFFELIENCHFKGTGDSFIGTAEYGEIKNCTVERTNTDAPAVFVQVCYDVSFYRCTAKGNVSGGAGTCGCFLGTGAGLFTECGSEGNVTSTLAWTGGFAGGPYSPFGLPFETKFERCYHKGNVSGGAEHVGGFAGNAGVRTCIFKDCYTVGDTVQSTDIYAGGFGGSLGQNNIAGITIKNCFSTQIVSGPDSGPFAGYLWPYDRWENCFYLDAPGQTVPVHEWESQGSPLSLAAMKQAVSFTGFNFTDVWGIHPDINDGFPYLLWEIPEPEIAFDIWAQKSNISRSVSDIWVQKSNVSRTITGVWTSKSGVWKQI